MQASRGRYLRRQKPQRPAAYGDTADSRVTRASESREISLLTL